MRLQAAPTIIVVALVISAALCALGCGGSTATIGKDAASEQAGDAAADRGAADARGDATPDGRVQADSRSGTDSKADVKPDLAADAALDVKAETADEIADEPPCVPACEGKECGEDGCGESCGECAWPEQCVAGVCVCVPDCDAKVCGPDGCGGTCGPCAAGLWCEGGACGQLKPVHVWSRRMGTSGKDEVNAVAVDGEGNIYVTGQLGKGPVDFGCGVLADVSGYFDAFLLKLSPSGECIWSKRLGTSLTATQGRSVGIASDGGVLVSGSFDGASLDMGEAGMLVGEAEYEWCCYDPTCQGCKNICSDIFLGRYSALGEALQAAEYGTCVGDWPTSAVQAFDGHVLLTGGFYAGFPLDLGGGPLAPTWSGEPAKGPEGFVARFSPLGGHLWSKSLSSPGPDFARQAQATGTGRVHVLGAFDWSEIDLGGGAVKMHDEPPGCIHNGGATSCTDMYLLALDEDGTHIWSKGMGGARVDEPFAMAIGEDGTTYVSGESDSQVFVSGTWSLPITASEFHDSDGVVGAVDADGKDAWWLLVWGEGQQGATSVAVGGDGRSYVAGYSTEDAFGVATQQVQMAGCAATAAFVSSIKDGQPLWTYGWCGIHNGLTAPVRIALEPSGCIVVASGVVGDSENIGGQDLLAVGGDNGFPGDVLVAKFCQEFVAVKE